MTGSRLHIWDESLPCQRVATPIHDHRFAFESTVLLGHLIHVEYDFQYSGKGGHRIYTPQRTPGTEDTKLVAMSDEAGRGYPLTRSRLDVIPGESYAFAAREFHETVYVGLTATLFRKTGESGAPPRILCSVDQEPDNDFHRDEQDVEALWTLIGRVLSEMGKLGDVPLCR